MHCNGTRNGVLTDFNGETGDSRCRYAKLGVFPGKNPRNGTPLDGSDIPSTRVRHRVAAVPLSHHLEQERSPARRCPVLGVPDRLHDGKDVHTVDLCGPSVSFESLESRERRNSQTWIPGMRSPRLKQGI